MGAETANTTGRSGHPSLGCSIDRSAPAVCYHRRGARPGERSSMGDRKANRGIYPPGSKSPHEWITCKQCGGRALARIGATFCSRTCRALYFTGENHPRWAAEDGGYHAKHERIKAIRGSADHCSRCGRSDDGVVYQWANLTGDYNDIWDFAPMCPACHGAYDAPQRPRGSALPIAKLTERAVAEARRRFAAGESARAMSRECGVSAVALRNAIERRTWKHVA